MSSTSGEEQFLGLMEIRVTALTVSPGVLLCFDHLMLNRKMAIKALDFMLRHVCRMDKSDVRISGDPFRFGVTSKAVLFGNCPIPNDDVTMTLKTINLFTNNLHMIEPDRLSSIDLCWRIVTECTS
jgi:hypothetical protein